MTVLKYVMRIYILITPGSQRVKYLAGCRVHVHDCTILKPTSLAGMDGCKPKQYTIVVAEAFL